MYLPDGRHKAIYDFETELEAIPLDFPPIQSIAAQFALHESLSRLVNSGVTDADVSNYYTLCGSPNSIDALMLIYTLQLLRRYLHLGKRDDE